MKLKFVSILKFSRFSFIVLAVIILSVGGIALGTIERNSDQISTLLAERGLSFLEVLERIVFSSVREDRPFEITVLADELIQVRDFLFVMLVDEEGTILLHSEPEYIGQKINYNSERYHDHGTINLPGGQAALWEEAVIYGKNTHLTFMEYQLPRRRPNVITQFERNNRLAPRSSTDKNENSNSVERREEVADRFASSNLSSGAQNFYERIVSVERVYAIVGQDMALHRQARRQADLVVLFISVAVVIILITMISLLQYITRHEEEKKRQEAKLNAVSDLTAGVAHEIRNPLSSIKGYATFFKQKFEKGSNEEVAASIMVEEVERLNRVIDELVGIGRTFEVERKEVNIIDVCSKLCHLLEPEIQERNIELKCLFDKDDEAIVRIDADKIRQAILNLILNAMESFEKDDEGKKIYLELVKKNKEVLISVMDNGSGIKKEILDRIFDPYFTTKTQGTGLGLVMVKNIIEAHNGELDISSPSSLADPRHHARNGTEVTIKLLLE